MSAAAKRAGEVTLSERIDGGSDVYVGAAFVGIVTDAASGGHLGLASGYDLADERPVFRGETVEDVARKLAEHYRRRGEPFWARKGGGSRRERAAAKWVRGERVLSLDELVMAAARGGRFFYGGRVLSGGFVINWSCRTASMRVGSHREDSALYHAVIDRPDGKVSADGEDEEAPRG